jgi:multiple sugar transport system ATP-binding protein
MARVVLEHLSKFFPGPKGQVLQAVRDLNLIMEDGELLVLVGPSGCGKTTTLRLIAGLEQPSDGTISIGGQDMRGVPARERDVAMVFQNHALYPHMTVRENLEFGLKLRHVPAPDRARRLSEAVEMLGLGDTLEQRPALLSSGQRQRVALGRALVRQPQLLLLDEPLSNLDTPLRAQMRIELARLQRRLGITMVYVTHDQSEAMTLGKRLAVMRDGMLQQVDAPLRVYHTPANLFVGRFFGVPSMNLFEGMLADIEDRMWFHTAPAPRKGEPITVPLPANAGSRMKSLTRKPLVMGLRPENVLLRSEELGVLPKETVFEAEVELVEPVGPETYVHLKNGELRFIARTGSDHQPHLGQRLRVGLNVEAVHFFDPVTGLRI